MPTYYEMNRDEIVGLSWREAFIKLYEEILDTHYRDAWDLGKVYLESKGYTIKGEKVYPPDESEKYSKEFKRQANTFRALAKFLITSEEADNNMVNVALGLAEICERLAEVTKRRI